MIMRSLRRGVPRLVAALVMVVGVLTTGAGSAAAAGCDATTVRWASSSNTLYVSGPVTCTLTQLDNLTIAPLSQVDPAAKIWLLGANLVLQQGATLQLHGSGAAGDVNELRLRSNNTSASTSIIYLRAYAGNISMRSTKVTSWDEAAGKPDTEYKTYKRSYIHVRSFLDANGKAQQSRLDISDSDLGYLGHNAAEAYGVTWKVMGTGVFDRVDVLGDVSNSRFHHNYFGAYTYGAFGMKWVGNEFDNNIQYGLDPHDDSDSLLIEGNYSHDNGNHGIICSQRCDNLTIRNNVSERNTGHGIMLHRSVTKSVVENNTAKGNTDTGIVLFESFDNHIVGNTTEGNLRGIRLSVGSANNLVERNTIANNSSYGIYLYKGSDVPVSGDGRPKFNRFVGNEIRDSGSYAVNAVDSDDNLFDGNIFRRNGGPLRFERSYRNRVINSDPSNIKVITVN